MNLSEKKKFISNFDLFHNLEEEHIESIADRLIFKTIPSKKTFISQGDLGDAVYFIVQGAVKIYLISEQGKEIVLGLSGPGDVVGEMALFDKQERSANVEAIEQVQLLILDRQEFINIVKDQPEIAINLLSALSKRLRSNHIVIEDMFSKNLHQRTLNSLIALSRLTRSKNLTLSQEDLAIIIGATRPRVNEALKKLEKTKKIRLSHKKITLL